MNQNKQSQWEADRDRRIAYAHSPRGFQFRSKLKNRVYVPSPLKDSVTSEDLVHDAVGAPAREEKGPRQSKRASNHTNNISQTALCCRGGIWLHRSGTLAIPIFE